ncbi:MAG TPA: bifunctional tRNA (5-methylaminomethyl-2-thiouridine)(34)-methyltransferase MnmD/FAD-dependent 5-carboxymethylaminomethyl-2-thiouridine(34) oxidoreductase MnmC [Fluviicoccus sp.]|nr:bifunctional tRNA (5-methylaminomethyl-2-thiouridine)(34)-methyltransferase MnmD/FAD-dependent 5-carboxymethylaminomethyl-2-thiouridine(34) oxidoreductase MnmC [Fluviicoccus sp.]
MVIVPADLEWRDGLPWSRQFGDIYFSVDNGLAEKRHVFLDGNRLAERFAAIPDGGGFTIAETGFGTGLNFLSTWRLWEQTAPPDAWLHFVSMEMYPLTADDLRRALDLWPELADLVAPLLAQYPFLTPGWHRLLFPDARITLTLLLGDARLLLPDLQARVDAWFLDGFSPDLNPELWQLELLTHLGRLSAPGATAATYTCAGAVRRAFAEFGFTAQRVKGFGRKREMLVAVNQTESPPVTSTGLDRPTPACGQKRVLVIGAGIAGVSCARALALRGWQVTLADRADGPGSAASGNPAAIIYPKIAPPHLSAWHFQQQGYLWLRQQVHDLNDIWRETGLLWLLSGNQQREGDKIDGHPWHPRLVEKVSAAEASALAGVRIDTDCLHFPQAGFLHPAALYRHWLADPRIRCLWRTEISGLVKTDSLWRAQTADSREKGDFDIVILANALDATRFAMAAVLPVYPVRGQIALMPGTGKLADLRKVLCYGGYLTPAFGGQHCIGASFIPNDADTGIRDEDHLHNRRLLQNFVPDLADALPDQSEWTGRASYRTQSADYLPLVGALTHPENPDLIPEGIYLSIGHGSKGFCYAPLAAEILAAELNGEPFPVARRVLKTLHPARFRLRERRRNPKARSEELTAI